MCQRMSDGAKDIGQLRETDRETDRETEQLDGKVPIPKRRTQRKLPVLYGQTSKGFARDVGVSHESLVAANPDVFDETPSSVFRRFKRMFVGGAMKSRFDPDDYVLHPGTLLNVPCLRIS